MKREGEKSTIVVTKKNYEIKSLYGVLHVCVLCRPYTYGLDDDAKNGGRFIHLVSTHRQNSPRADYVDWDGDDFIRGHFPILRAYPCSRRIRLIPSPVFFRLRFTWLWNRFSLGKSIQRRKIKILKCRKTTNNADIQLQKKIRKTYKNTPRK